jgi:hypothetical protein
MDLTDIPIIAIAVSVVICWALIAIVCSSIHEAIAQIKAERGRFMRKYLLNQLQDDPNDTNWASLLYMHGTIDLLSRDAGEPPGNIDSRIFAETLIDVVGNSLPVKARAKEEGVAYQHAALQNFKAATEILVPSDVVSFFTQSLSSAEQSYENSGDPERENNVYTKLVENVETWHKDLMQRMTFWYKKKTRVRLFWLGAILGLVLNLDSIQLFNHFSANPESRKVMIEYHKQNAEALQGKMNSIQWDSIQLASMRDSIRSYYQSMDSFARTAELPVGFSNSVFKKTPSTGIFWYLVAKILGILITGFTASMGSSFWFDLLKKAQVKKV